MCLLSPCKDPMALWTHLHTCSSSSTLSMGECVLCIMTSFCFTLSTSRLSGTPVRTPRRSMAASPFSWSRFWVRRWLEPSWLCSSTRAFARWDLRGLSTQENMALSSAKSEDRGGSLLFRKTETFFYRQNCCVLFIFCKYRTVSTYLDGLARGPGRYAEHCNGIIRVNKASKLKVELVRNVEINTKLLSLQTPVPLSTQEGRNLRNYLKWKSCYFYSTENWLNVSVRP